MSVELRLTEDKLTAVLNGEIDHHTGRALRDAIDKKISQTKPSELILDFGFFRRYLYGQLRYRLDFRAVSLDAGLGRLCADHPYFFRLGAITGAFRDS